MFELKTNILTSTGFLHVVPEWTIKTKTDLRINRVSRDFQNKSLIDSFDNFIDKCYSNRNANFNTDTIGTIDHKPRVLSVIAQE